MAHNHCCDENEPTDSGDIVKFARRILVNTVHLSNQLSGISSDLTSVDLAHMRKRTLNEIDARMRKLNDIRKSGKFNYMTFAKWKSLEIRYLTDTIDAIERNIIFHGPDKESVKKAIMTFIGKIRIPKEFSDISDCLMTEAECWCDVESDGSGPNSSMIKSLYDLRKSLAELKAGGNKFRMKYDKEKRAACKLRIADDMEYIRSLRRHATMYGRQARTVASVEKLLRSLR